LPVVNSQGEILGIISQHDLNRIASPRKDDHGGYLYDSSLLCKYILQQHLIKDTITLSPEDTLENAVELMARKKLGCIPIVGPEGKVVGITTPVDMMRLFLKDLRGTH
jgi:CBS domain-containing protein